MAAIKNAANRGLKEVGTVTMNRAEAHSTKLDPTRYDLALLDSAILNLNIAQQYVDESKRLTEQRLISFHYAIALLARHRGEKQKQVLGLVRNYLLDAANWELPVAAGVGARATGGDTPEASAHNQSTEVAEETLEDPWVDAHRRIICEAEYNLGVVEEIDREWLKARAHYRKALRNALKPSMDPTGTRDLIKTVDKYRKNYVGVGILSEFGDISSSVSYLRDSPRSRKLKAAVVLDQEIIPTREMTDSEIKKLQDVLTDYRKTQKRGFSQGAKWRTETSKIKKTLWTWLISRNSERTPVSDSRPNATEGIPGLVQIELIESKLVLIKDRMGQQPPQKSAKSPKRTDSPGMQP